MKKQLGLNLHGDNAIDTTMVGKKIAAGLREFSESLKGGDPLKVTTIARTSHPETSHEAEAEFTATGKRVAATRHALAVLRKHPGSTARELDVANGSLEREIGKRLNDLRTNGLAVVRGSRLCLVTGNKAQVWWPVSI